MSDYNYLAKEKRDKIAKDARFGGEADIRIKHGKKCVCEFCKREAAIQRALKALDQKKPTRQAR